MPAVAEIAVLLVVLLEDRSVVHIVELVLQIVAPVLFRFLQRLPAFVSAIPALVPAIEAQRASLSYVEVLMLVVASAEVLLTCAGPVPAGSSILLI